MNIRVLPFALLATVTIAGCNTARLGYGGGYGGVTTNSVALTVVL